MKNILLALIPLFVAVDAIGIMPLFVSLTQGLANREKDRVIGQSVMTALGVALGFILVGQGIFHVLGITIGDFMVAGGVILFVLAINDMLSPSQRRRIQGNDLGVVPLGTPMIVGPAVLTTCLVSISEYGMLATIVSIVVNILLAGLLLKLSSRLITVLGDAGTKALSKVMSLLLAAIAVMLTRRGLEQLLSS
ncbi:MAG: MarC family protein [Sedimentisphaerales bacterium]|jgi:multiple antibiotic resistance protein|nr:MarC family protein [Sedimentisphaerales bacterium]